MPVPYDTGKVKIGLAHERYQRNIPSKDMVRLQQSLLMQQQYDSLRPNTLERVLDVGMAVVLAIAITLGLIAWFTS